MPSQMKRRFIDSNIFIYVLLKDPRYGEACLRILERVERGEEQGVTSTLTLSQVIAHLARHGRGEAIKLFIDYVREIGMMVIETTFLDFVEAVTEMGELNLDYKIWDDLVISCQMKRSGVQEIYTNDRDFEKIKWVKPIFPVRINGAKGRA